MAYWNNPAFAGELTTVKDVGEVFVRRLSAEETIEYNMSNVASVDEKGVAVPLPAREANFYKVRYVALCVADKDTKQLPSLQDVAKMPDVLVNRLYIRARRLNGKKKPKPKAPTSA
jgi:hypothetical protein